MFAVSILPSRGNPNAPEFPFDGLFGLTDVFIRGKLAIKFDQRHPNPKPVDATSAVVRLVRIDVLNRVTVREVVCEETVWSSTNGFARMGEMEVDFELVVPMTTVGMSRMGMMIGKAPGHCASTSWKLEAIVAFPRERPVSAPPREVSLLRHTLPALSSPSIPSLVWASSISPFTTHPVPLEYEIRIPNRPLCWNDSSELSFHFRSPQSASVLLKSLELVLSREVVFLYGSTTSSIVDDIPLDLFHVEDSPKGGFSPFATPTSTPTEEIDRQLWRSPSPPDKSSSSGIKSSWPLSLVEGEAGFVEMRGMLKFRPRPASNHRWSLGETGENKFLRITYTIRPRISYKRSHGSFASERHLDLDRLPLRVGAVNISDRMKAVRTPRMPTEFTGTLSERRMGERRNSDFNLRLDLSPAPPSYSAPPLPSPSTLDDRRVKTGTRPLSSRRRSEQSEAVGQPARTRARTEEPKAKRRPATATGIVPAPSMPDLATMPQGLSPSSTYESLGPDTPNTLEFLLTPIPTVTCEAPASPPRTGSFPLATPAHRIHHTSSSPRPPSTRSIRSPRHSHRPRSAGTLSIASTASTASSMADSPRFSRETSAPPMGNPGSTILESSHELLGLTLSDPLNGHSPLANGVAVPAETSPSPSSSPEMSFSSFEPQHSFRSYSIASASSTTAVASAPHLPFDRHEATPWDAYPAPDLDVSLPPNVLPSYDDTVPPRSTFSNHSPSRRPRHHSPTSSTTSSNLRNHSPPSPPMSLKGSSLRHSNLPYTPGTGPTSSRTSLSPESASIANQKRKGSVGGLLSLITRRSSKA